MRTINLEQALSFCHLDLQLKDRMLDQLYGVGESNQDNGYG
jgi:hypothetical protein